MRLALIAAVVLALVHGMSMPSVAQPLSPERVLGAQMRLSARLAAEMAKQPRKDPNIVISPASVAGVMALLDIGADAKMRGAIWDMLGFKPALGHDATSDLAALRTTITNAPKNQKPDDAKFDLANIVMFDPAAKPYDRAIKEMRATGAEVSAAPLSDVENIKRINRWVAEKTQNLIPGILEEQPLPPGLVAVNALYFKGLWPQPFDKRNTKPQAFHMVAGDTEVPMMHTKERYRFKRDGEFAAVEMPYRGGRYTIAILTNTQRSLALPDFAAVAGWLDGAGFACTVGGAGVLCIHGNEVDDWNVTDYEALRRNICDEVQGRPSLVEWIPNAGTKLVIDVMNRIKARYAFIDLLKPENQAAVRVLVALNPDLRPVLTEIAGVARKRIWDSARRAIGLLGAGESEGPTLTVPSARKPMPRDVAGLLERTEQRFTDGVDPVDIVNFSQSQMLGVWDALASGLMLDPPYKIAFEAIKEVAHDDTFNTNCADAAFEARLHQALLDHGAELICNAGFMRLLTGGFVDRWKDRQLNIHPSLLPAFPGLDTHKRALDSGALITGCTVHFIRLEMDSGPIVAQAAVAVMPGDTPETLAELLVQMA